jgi:hypothetical protein
MLRPVKLSHWCVMLKHAERFYIQLGARLERARFPIDAARALHDIRTALAKEHPDDLPDAKRLIERGRADAR